MVWNMNCLGLLILCTVLFPIVNKAQGAGECKSQRLSCYDCDSRYDQNCGDPFNHTLPQELRPATKICHGCCVKFVHRFPDGEWVQRSCTENIIINYFMVDHVCMGEGKGHGKMCFCESNNCNPAPPSSRLLPLSTPTTFFIHNPTLVLSLAISLLITPTLLFFVNHSDEGTKSNHSFLTSPTNDDALKNKGRVKVSSYFLHQPDVCHKNLYRGVSSSNVRVKSDDKEQNVLLL